MNHVIKIFLNHLIENLKDTEFTQNNSCVARGSTQGDTIISPADMNDEKNAGIDFSNVKQVKLLVLTHGEIGNKFWDEFDMAFIKLQRFYGFKLDIKRFGQSGVEKQLEFLKQFENKLLKNQNIDYNCLCSTVLTKEIGENLNNIASKIPTVTYNTSVTSIPNAIEYVGAGRDGERSQGEDVAIQSGLYITNNILKLSEYNFDLVKNDNKVNESFKKVLSDTKNVIVISFSEDVDNQAFIDRHDGVKKIFENAIYYKNFEHLKKEILKKPKQIVVGFCLQESVLDILSTFLNDNNITSILGVTDITSETLKKLNEDNNLVAVSGFAPINQGNMVASANIGKVFGIFDKDIDKLKLFTPIGNAQSKSLNLSSKRSYDSIWTDYKYEDLFPGKTNYFMGASRSHGEDYGNNYILSREPDWDMLLEYGDVGNTGYPQQLSSAMHDFLLATAKNLKGIRLANEIYASHIDSRFYASKFFQLCGRFNIGGFKVNNLSPNYTLPLNVLDRLDMLEDYNEDVFNL